MSRDPVMGLSGEIWAIDQRAISDLLATVRTLDVSAAAKAAYRPPTAAELEPYSVRDGVAHVSVKGPILKTASALLRYFGIEHASAADIGAAIDLAASDSDVASIMLDVDSPGGTVSGVAEAAERVYAARSAKPVAAHVSDLGASAAYWLAAQADTVTACPSAEVGSIGVYSVVEDSSRAAANEGIVVHVVASGPLKGAGVPGAPVTDDQIADVRRGVEAYNDLFVSAVASGRGISIDAARAMATGQVWLGDEANKIGLTDGVCSAEQAHLSAARRVLPLSAPGAATMAIGTEHAGALSLLHGVVATVAPGAGAEEREMSLNPTVAGTADVGNHELKERELVSARAEADVLRATLAAVRAAQRDNALALAQAAGKVTPAMMESMQKLGEAYGDNVAGFEAALAAFPVVVRAERASVVAVVSANAVASDGEEQVARWLGTSADRIAKIDDVRGIRADGQVEMSDGRIMSRDAWRKLAGFVAALFVILFAGDVSAAPLAAARQTSSKSLGDIKTYKVKASHTVYAGGMVMIDSAGYAHAAEASASNNGVVGVAVKTVTAAASGVYWVEVQSGVFKFKATSIAITSVADIMYASNDQTFDETPGANEPVAGILLEVVSSTEGWIFVASYLPSRVYSTADPMSLTGDLTVAGGAGAITLSDTDSSIVLRDNDSTALLVGSTGTLDLLTVDTTDGVEGLLLSGYSTQVDQLKTCYGTSADACFEYDTSQTPDSFVLGLGADSEGLIVCQKADMATDFTHADQANPTLWIQSADATTVAQYVSIAHDQTDAHINTGAGDLHLEPAGSDVKVTGRVSVTDSIALSDGLTIDQSANNKLSVAENSEDFEITFSNDALALSSTTGVVSFDFGAVLPKSTGTGALGWAVVALANTACNSTCTHACVFGQNTGDMTIVGCADAGADVCVCAGAN